MWTQSLESHFPNIKLCGFDDFLLTIDHIALNLYRFIDRHFVLIHYNYDILQMFLLLQYGLVG